MDWINGQKRSATRQCKVLDEMSSKLAVLMLQNCLQFCKRGVWQHLLWGAHCGGHVGDRQHLTTRGSVPLYPGLLGVDVCVCVCVHVYRHSHIVPLEGSTIDYLTLFKSGCCNPVDAVCSGILCLEIVIFDFLFRICTSAHQRGSNNTD